MWGEKKENWADFVEENENDPWSPSVRGGRGETKLNENGGTGSKNGILH